MMTNSSSNPHQQQQPTPAHYKPGDDEDGGGGGWSKRIEPFPHLRFNIPMGGWVCGACRSENDCRGYVCAKCKRMFRQPRGGDDEGEDEEQSDPHAASSRSRNNNSKVEGVAIAPSRYVVLKGAIPIATTLPTIATDPQNDDNDEDNDEGDEGSHNDEMEQQHEDGKCFSFPSDVVVAHRQELQRITNKPSIKKLALPATIAALIANMNSRMKYVAIHYNRPTEDVPEVVIDAQFWKEIIEAFCTTATTPSSAATTTTKKSKKGDNDSDSDLDDFLKDLESDDDDDSNNGSNNDTTACVNDTDATTKKTPSTTTLVSPEIVNKKFIIIRQMHVTRISVVSNNKAARGGGDEDSTNNNTQQRGATSVEYRFTAELDSEADAAALLQCAQGFLPYVAPAAVGAPLEFFTGRSDLTTPPAAPSSSSAPPSASSSSNTLLPPMRRMFEEVTVSTTKETLMRFAPQSDITALNALGYSYKNFMSYTHVPDLLGVFSSSSKSGGGGDHATVVIRRPSLLPSSAHSILTDPSRSNELRSLMMLLYKRGDEHKDLLPDEQAFYDANAASVFMMTSGTVPPTTTTDDDIAVPQQEQQIVVDEGNSNTLMKTTTSTSDGLKETGTTTTPSRGMENANAATTPTANTTAPTLAEKKAALFARLQEKRAMSSAAAAGRDLTISQHQTPSPISGGSSSSSKKLSNVQGANETQQHPKEEIPVEAPAFGPDAILAMSQATHMVFGMPAPLSYPRATY